MKSLLLPTVTALLNSNCTTPDAATRCQGSCTRENYECVSRCPPSDSSCHAECSRQAVQCEERKIDFRLFFQAYNLPYFQDVRAWASSAGQVVLVLTTQEQVKLS